MGFFSLLETFFFISLAITFVLIIMLVYHFKGRLVSIEDRYHTMFEIVNSLVKEMKNLRDTMVQTQALAQAQAPTHVPSPVDRPPFGGNAGGFPTELFRLFQSGPGMFPTSRANEEDDYEEEDDDEEEGEYKKIVVSDTELDSEDGDEYDENNVKVISLATETIESVSLDELEEPEVIDMTPEEEVIDIDISPEEDEEPNIEEEQPVVEEETSTEQMDYRKLDVSYLKTMVLTRGLATDTKKMKKSELIRLLEEAN
jgi:hypothetical protein